ncbi:MAG: hypothetical protein JW716_03150 [Candidatus Aenigmarchaeota archaeon]|nr:hypothetical protein [Candidatus Aenigmarchaeota archaeon]
MYKKPALMMTLVFLVALSGCADMPMLSGWLGGTEVEQYTNDVVVIKEVKVTPVPIVQPGQTLSLSAVVKNVQEIGFDVKRDVTVTIYDTCGIFTIEGSGLCGGDWTNSGQTCLFKELYPQTENEIIWRLRANDIKVEQSCNVGIEVKYSYYTETTSSVDFASQKEVERMIREGEGTSSVGKMTLGEGPVKLYIQVPNQPILVGDDFEKSNGILEFWAENKGSGIVDGGKVTYFKINNSVEGRAKFRKTLEDTNSYDEIIAKDYIKGAPGETDYSITMQLINKKTPKNTWIITPGNENIGKIRDRIYLTGIVTYDYKFTKTIKLTVQPIR